MVGKVGARSTQRQNDFDFKLRFGGGLNTRASDDEIDAQECASGENFLLDLRDSQFRRREQFDLAGTAPNGQEIRGYAQLRKTDGTVTTLIQAGTQVYSTDFTTWTSVGSVNASSRLRGPRTHNWNLTDICIVTDLELQEPIKQWNGTTLVDVVHSLVGEFKAKYCVIANDRAFYGNVDSNSSATPHVVVGSKLEDYTDLSVANRPSSSLGTADSFFLTTKDLRPINGMVEAFNVIALSTDQGRMWKLSGNDATDFVVDQFYPESAADGDEALAFVGNDIIYGRQGRIESLIATERFGDVETDDLSRDIEPTIRTYGGWKIAYNSRLQRVYFHPSGKNELWVFHKPITSLEISPWSKWTTRHAFSFNPSTMMSLLDPDDGLEYVFGGDANGNVYRLEGTGTGGDAGSTAIRSFRQSRMAHLDGFAQAHDFEGQLLYRKGDSVTANIKMLWQGEQVFNESVNLSMPAETGVPIYGSTFYYNDGTTIYGSALSGRLVRERFGLPGQGSDLQIEIEVDDTDEFKITEIRAAFEAGG